MADGNSTKFPTSPKLLLDLFIGLSSRGAEKLKQMRLKQHGAFRGQPKIRWNVNMMLRGKGTQRAAGQEKEVGRMNKR